MAKRTLPRRTPRAALAAAMATTAAAAALAALVALPAPRAAAHECDNFLLPPLRTFADLGDGLTRWMYDILDRAVERTNAQIKERLDAGQTEEQLADLHDPQHMVDEVKGQIPWALPIIDGLEREIHAGDTKARFPGRVTAFKQGFGGVYAGAGLPIDPRQLVRLFFSSTFRAYDVHMGTDKVGHFTDMGLNYYRSWRAARAAGKSEEEAVKAAYASNLNNPILSEAGFLGFVTAGSYSNADLVSNYCGFLLYRNVVEPVKVKGEVRPPLVVRDGPYWKLNDHVRRDSDFFAVFFSEHFDESLNPSTFDPTLRGGIKTNVARRAGQVLQHHADAMGNRRPREWFERKHEELRTYYGEPYGHKGVGEELIKVSELCFKPVKADEDVAARDNVGQTALHRAALYGDAATAAALLKRGAQVDARVASDEVYNSDWGSTPLHQAAKAGHAEAARVLLDAKADPNAANARGLTPLHLAVRYPAVMRLLLERGARPEARNARGRSVLAYAAADVEADAGAVAALAERSPSLVAEADAAGRAPLHHAAETGRIESLAALLKAGARTGAEDPDGVTPLHLAAGRKDGAAFVAALLEARATVDVEDDYGRTPLHEAARAGPIESVRRLLEAGADARAADAYGVTPLHLAARRARLEVAALLLDRGADPNAATLTGTTPLHEAALAEHPASVRQLLARGAKPAVKDARGREAAAVARGKSAEAVRGLLGTR